MFRWPISKLPLLFNLVFSLSLGILFISEYAHADIAPPRPNPKPLPSVNPNIGPPHRTHRSIPRSKPDITLPRPSSEPSPRPETSAPPAVDRPSSSLGGAIAINYFSFGLTTGELFAATGSLLLGLETLFLFGLIKTRKRKLDE